jgi:cytochrome c oxidase subunit 2
MLNVQFMPVQASEFAVEYDALFWVTTLLTAFFTLATGAVVLYFALRYRQGNKVDRSNPVDHNSFLEMAWSIIPMFMALIMFAWAAKAFVDQRTPPDDSMEVFVIGKQWMWHSQHENGVRENNRLTVPVGRNVRLTMISQDVLHSYFIPQFRIKQDVLPGRYTSQWFKATLTGTFNLFCTEYCGTQHSEMGGYVRVLSESDWAKWAANGGDDLEPVVSLAERGKKLFDKNACANCHTAQDNERAPTLYGLMGRTRKMTNGMAMIADREYVRRALKDPYGQIVEGYDKTMPDYKDLTEEDFLALFEYLKSLGTAGTVVTQDLTPAQPGP